MDAITYSAARQNLAKTMEKVYRDHCPVVVTRKSANSVIIMSLEDYESLEETAYLFKESANRNRSSMSFRVIGRGVSQMNVDSFIKYRKILSISFN